MSPIYQVGGWSGSALLLRPMADGMHNRRPLPRTDVIWLAEIFLYLATALNMPWWFTCLILLLMWALLAVIIIRSEWTVNQSPIAKGTMCVLAAGLVWALGSRTVLQQYRQANSAEKKPDVTLRFVYPKGPALVLINQSDVVARDMKWVVVLWNIDTPARANPLPIPATAFDWLRPHQVSGPEDLFSGPLVAPLLKPGAHLVGSASVICPDCSRGHTFIVSIVWGEGGWFAEVEDMKDGNTLIPQHLVKPEIELPKFAEALSSAVPQRLRIPIGEP